MLYKKITIDGKEYKVPKIVSELMSNMKGACANYEHMTMVWYHKVYAPNKEFLPKDSFEHEMAHYAETCIQGFEERLADFKKIDEEISKAKAQVTKETEEKLEDAKS